MRGVLVCVCVKKREGKRSPNDNSTAFVCLSTSSLFFDFLLLGRRQIVNCVDLINNKIRRSDIV